MADTLNVSLIHPFGHLEFWPDS